MKLKRPPVFDPLVPHEAMPSFAATIKFPDNIVELTAANVSELLGKYSKLMGYANTHRSHAQVMLMRLELRLTQLEAEVRTKEHGFGLLQKWKQQVKLNTFPAIQDIKERIVKEQIKLEQTKTLMEVYDKYTVALSRELSRKVAMNDGMTAHLRERESQV